MTSDPINVAAEPTRGSHRKARAVPATTHYVAREQKKNEKKKKLKCGSVPDAQIASAAAVVAARVPVILVFHPLSA